MLLLERESSLRSLAGYAEEARRGEGRLVLVAGEAGVGKSALAERLERDLPDARWYWGACDGLFTPRPLGPLFDFAGQLGGELLELRRAGAARQELFAALLGQVSEPGTLDVVVVEDIHWADEATVDMLCFLGRRIKNASVLLIATYREEDLAAGDLLRAALGELARQRSTRRVELGPLSPGAVRELAGPTGLDAAELHRLTGGNPFYVMAVIAAGVTEIPPAARDAVLAPTGWAVVGYFICGVPSIIAVIMNYARRSETRGTFLESHFRWQIRTFWFAVLWALVIGAVTLPLWILLIGIPMTFVGFAILGIWIIYRVLRGWLALRDRRPMYV
jgi:uncharacterized membrane protein